MQKSIELWYPTREKWALHTAWPNREGPGWRRPRAFRHGWQVFHNWQKQIRLPVKMKLTQDPPKWGSPTPLWEELYQTASTLSSQPSFVRHPASLMTPWSIFHKTSDMSQRSEVKNLKKNCEFRHTTCIQNMHLKLDIGVHIISCASKNQDSQKHCTLVSKYASNIQHQHTSDLLRLWKTKTHKIKLMHQNLNIIVHLAYYAYNKLEPQKHSTQASK